VEGGCLRFRQARVCTQPPLLAIARLAARERTTAMDDVRNRLSLPRKPLRRASSGPPTGSVAKAPPVSPLKFHHATNHMTMNTRPWARAAADGRQPESCSHHNSILHHTVRGKKSRHRAKPFPHARIRTPGADSAKVPRNDLLWGKTRSPPCRGPCQSVAAKSHPCCLPNPVARPTRVSEAFTADQSLRCACRLTTLTPALPANQTRK
jgi:hypothetical protein